MSETERQSVTPRTVMFGGKAFATYTNAKLIVKLVNDVGSVVNNDPETNKYLKVSILNTSFVYLIPSIPVKAGILMTSAMCIRSCSFQTTMYLWQKC